jgi:hypothetical protein
MSLNGRAVQRAFKKEIKMITQFEVPTQKVQ